ncbi:hypothetical protein GGS21DRAFT_502362 [Xylaria nigripes]|nr:hypothetical protein GGS21DRAFT_502362 [Xylaria nigripes]
MIETNHFGCLPDEILIQIVQFITSQDAVMLQSVSKRFLRICRDNHYWHTQCFHTSSAYEHASLFQNGIDCVDEDGIQLSAAAAEDQAMQHHSATQNISSLTARQKKKEYLRCAANWNPAFPGEKTDWYHEYIQRNASTTTNWFERARTPNSSTGDTIEVRGVSLYAPSKVENQLFAVSPLEDGSICIWDVKGSMGRKGSILSKSNPGLLWHAPTTSSIEKSINSIGTGIVECVSVDSQRHRAFFALGHNLVEVDLQSLAVVTTTPFEDMITTISAADPSVPLTVGTFGKLFLHDYRIRHTHTHSRLWHEWETCQSSPPYKASAQPGPQFIHHMERHGHHNQLSDDIFVAGRFGSILHYDRRMFPSIKGTLHSGGRLCSLTSMPYPFSSLDSELRRRLELTEEEVIKSKSALGRTLIACGEYNTKGSLEIYGVSSSPDHSDKYSPYNSTMKNRQTASSSKLLSVITHGNRILFSDGQGYLKWMERDGFTEVRRHRIGKAEKDTHRSLFASTPGSDDIARKLLSTQTEVSSDNPNEDDVLFWTGEALGLVSFTSKPGSSPESFVENTKAPEELAKEEKEQLYDERLRLALERQADEVRFLRNLGMPRMERNV